MKKVGEITEREVIFLMDEMCMESLSPIGLLRWEEIKHTLETNRKALDTPETPVAKDVIQPKDREALKDRGIQIISCGCNDFKHHTPIFMTPLEHKSLSALEIAKILSSMDMPEAPIILVANPPLIGGRGLIDCEGFHEVRNIHIEDFNTTEVIEKSMPFDKFRNPYKGKKKRRSK